MYKIILNLECYIIYFHIVCVGDVIFTIKHIKQEIIL